MTQIIQFIRIFLVLKLLLVRAEEELVVKINDGLVKGTLEMTKDGTAFIAFEGIPFAKPPIGKRRFKEPQSVEPWSGTLIANTKYTCIQYGILDNSITGQEDCLYLNVYVPRQKVNPQERLAVNVNIHGGGFMGGSSTNFSASSRMMDWDIIYVSANYRVGPFGFLSTEDSHVTGNFGLKDQSFALHWVKDNIASFGGNPDSVTITGMSAGGASVHLHYFSPMSTGLFHRGIAQSGTALNPWALQKQPYENFKKLTNLIGCYNENIPNALECLRQRSALQIAEVIKQFYVDGLLPLIQFNPVIEPISNSAFMHIHPYVQLTTKITNDLPLIISMTTDEGILPAGFFYNQQAKLNKDWKTLFPLILDYYHIADEDKQRINDILKEYYLKNESITEENFKNFVKMCTDRYFLVGSVKSAKLQSNVSHSSIYYLLMGYGGDLTAINKIFSNSELNLGIPHGADGKFYYDFPLWSSELQEDEKIMRDKLTDMLVNFVKTGNVSLGDVDWKPVGDSESFDYVLVKGPHDIIPKRSEEITPISFWASLGLKEDENFNVQGN